MSESPTTPSAEPAGHDPAELVTRRAELHLVRDDDTAAETDPPIAEAQDPVEAASETDGEATGPAPVRHPDGSPASPQAPLDVRIREAALGCVRGIPALGESPASLRESLEYSQTGDWAVSEKSAKRVVHGMATVLTYLVTYPLVDLLGRARTKPGPFVVAVLMLIAAVNVAVAFV